MAEWRDYRAQGGAAGHTVAGALKVLPDLWSPQLENHRDVLVCLPPSYELEQTRRYPVLYMHDGQNLFDRATSYAGEWQVDETLKALSLEGLEVLVVGIPNMGKLRVAEYTPFTDPVAGGGQGDQYLAFLIETVKPLIDADFRTLPGRRDTGIAGSSLGGLISLYALFRHPGVFGQIGALSPALDFAGGAVYDYIARAGMPGGRIYMDVGTREAGIPGQPGTRVQDDWSQSYLEAVQRMHGLLLQKGYCDGSDMLYVEEEDAVHHESAWARRLPAGLRFLLG